MLASYVSKPVVVFITSIACTIIYKKKILAIISVFRCILHSKKYVFTVNVGNTSIFYACKLLE